MPSRSATPGADSQGPQSHQWSHARPTPFTASRCPRHPAAHVAPPGASPHRAAEPAPPTTLPKVINKGAVPRPPRPWHQHEADPGAKKQKYAQNCNFFAIANCREASKRGLTPGKAANRTHSGPFPPRGGRKWAAIAKKLHRSRNFCFCETDRRNGAILAKDRCAFNANQAEQQHGTTAHRPYKHSCPHPWQRSRASSTEKCNI